MVAISTRQVAISNTRGLHARAAAKLVTLSERFMAEVQVCYDGQTVTSASIMGLMMLGAAVGAVLTLRADGADADAALSAMVELIESGFHEID